MDYKILVDTIASVGIIVSVLYGARQIEMAKSSNTLSSILYIQKENFEIRKKILISTSQIEILLNELTKKDESFMSIYSKENFNDIREFGYHYELIGILVKNNSLKFDTVFELIPFPDEFWKKSEKLRILIRKNHISDYWVNFEYLSELYLKKEIN